MYLKIWNVYLSYNETNYTKRNIIDNKLKTFGKHFSLKNHFKKTIFIVKLASNVYKEPLIYDKLYN